MTDQPKRIASDAKAKAATCATAGAAVALPPANFTLIYESKDGRLCLFEDANGHLTSVRASKLA